MPETTTAPIARYHWIATFSWIDRDAGVACTWSNNGPAASDGTVSRADVLRQVRELAADQAGVPPTAHVLFFSVEPEMLPGGAS